MHTAHMSWHARAECVSGWLPVGTYLAFPVKTRNFVRWGHTRALDEMSTLINLCF
jgi:hypothetical protein